MSRFEGRARKEETGDDLDSVGAVLVEGACLESLACFFLLTIAFPVRDFELDAAPELGAQDVLSTNDRVSRSRFRIGCGSGARSAGRSINNGSGLS